MPFLDALPMPEKYASGTDIAKAHGQDTTRNISPRYNAVLKSPVTAHTIPQTRTDSTNTPSVYQRVIFEIKVSVLDFLLSAFSIRFIILETVLSVQLLVVFITKTPSKTMLPDKISSPSLIVKGKLSPVKL